jgi:tetratricopeptide (TPR) repeat protein
MRALEAYQAASDDPDDMGWRIARIRLIERSAPGEAPGAWRRFLSDHPGSIPARKAALDSGHVRRDQALAQEIIDQLKGLSGDQGLAWRVAQARLNLQKGRPADLQRAAQLLEQVVLAAPRRLEAQMMLVECLRRQGNYAKALNRIGQVVQISENSASLRLLQAELMFRYGDKGQAQQVLDSLLASPDLPSSVVRGASDLLARQGRYASAIRTLMRLHPPQETPADLQLARYQLQAGNTDRAEAIARKSVAEETGAPAIAFLAELLARTGRADEGKAILGRLSRLEIDQSRRLMIQGRFAESYGDPQEAVSFYRRAVAAAPEDLATHVQLIRYLMTTGQADELAQAVTDAGDLPDETGMVAFLSDNIQLLRETAGLAPARDFWLGAMTNAEHREAALAGIGLIRTVDARQEVAAEDLAELRRIADSEPDFLPVQLLAARLSMAAGRSQDAIAWANRAVQAFPDAIEPAWILSEALAAEGRWAEALSAAQQWRSRSRGQALGADMLIAEGQIQLGRADRAVAQLETHVQQAMENPHQAQPVINRYARALILAGKADQAAKALRPLLTTDARYRRAWITLAVLVIAEPDRSRAWLGEVTPLIPAGAHGEHITLADAWYQLSRRDERPEDIDRAEAILSPLIQVSPDAAITLGVMHDMQGQVAEAETLYRQGLEGDASESLSAIAANNLAMILVQRGEGLAEAQRLARLAVEARPRSANFHDTLAQAHLARRQFDRAVGTLEKAVRLEPVNPKWMLQLAEAQLRAGRSGEARKSLLKLQRIYPERNMLPPELRAQLADLDRRLRS